MTQAVTAGAPVAQRVAHFVSDVVVPNAEAMARGEGPAPDAVVRRAADYGVAGLLIPAEYGGAGATHLEFVQAIEQIAAACASTAVILDVHLSVAAEPIVGYGSDAAKERWLPKMATGEAVGAFALTEPQSGSDAAAMTTRATLDDEDYILEGSKAFITNSGAAGVYVVFARTGDARSDITAFVVAGHAPGVATGEPLHKLGLRGSLTAELHLSGVRIAAAGILGTPGAGFGIAMSALDSGRIGIAAQAVGMAQGALDVIVAAGQRGRSLDEVRVADIAAQIAAARQLTHHAARCVDAGVRAGRHAALAKLYATDTGMNAAQAAVELCEPESAAEYHPAAIRFRDAKAAQIYEGTNQVQRIVIARDLLRDGAAAPSGRP